ncbi:lytic transglycosylase domain-containing protein [Streptomyces sp. NPDC058685]|uniref:lytic transglycosylase domain-containing protein n=1 Tax=Streptomyces sp. NPDC058685 TaxID=3346598 RepID=UPI00365A8145
MAAQFGRRLRRGATTTAVAAAAVAALSASQAPGITHATTGDSQGASDATPPPGTPVTGNSPYYTDLPPLNTPDKPGTSVDLPATGTAEAGIPATVLAAYKQAEQTIAASDPGCHVPWQLLAAIGKVESGQARGGKVDADGTTFSPILGPVLNGVGFANISDTDNGAFDGDSTHDRAVGPMQFIPSTWATWGQDANGDGRKDPNNIYDAALAAGRYLCAGDRDLGVKAHLDRAILGYNHSQEYLRTVLSWFDYYKRGTHEVPDGTGVLPDTSGPDSFPAGAETLPSPSPTPPGTPGTTPKPTPPAKPGGGTKPPTTPTTPPPTTTPPSPIARIERAGAAELTAMAGRDFAEKATVRVKNAAGRTVAKQPVRFEIVGDTDARFAGGKTSTVAATGADGTVAAPVIKAGEKTGTFTVRASVVGRTLPAVSFTGTVVPRAADAIRRTSHEVLTAAPGAEFAQTVELKATYQGSAAEGVPVTATLIKSAEDPAANDKGPYFKDAEDKPVRTLTDLKTRADGLLTLPKIFADDVTGTFLLRLTTAGGGTVTIELKVVAPDTPTTPPTTPPATPSAPASPAA